MLRDETIVYSGAQTVKQGLPPVWRIVFRDESLWRSFVFTTNRFDCDAALVTQIYKQRWQVELFFKWIKQKSFVGVSDNAVNHGGDVSLCVDGVLEIHFTVETVFTADDTVECVYPWLDDGVV